MKVVALVPIKLNSRRVANKNIRNFEGGNPLCTYILDTLLEVDEIDEIYVYCSDEKIKNYIPQGVKFLKRDESLDRDQTKINEVIKSFSQDVNADIYVQTHATSPFISAESIGKAIKAIKDEGFDSAFAVTKLQTFMWKNGKPFNYSMNAVPRTQDLEPLYVETSGFYAYTYDVVNNLERRIGEKPKMIEVADIEAIDIDEESDFDFANLIFKALKK